MSHPKVTEHAAETAHELVNQAEHRIGELEQQVRELLTSRGDQALEVGADARELASETLQDLENYIREKPLQAAGMAFGAGLLAALVLRR